MNVIKERSRAFVEIINFQLCGGEFIWCFCEWKILFMSYSLHFNASLAGSAASVEQGNVVTDKPERKPIMIPLKAFKLTWR